NRSIELSPSSVLIWRTRDRSLPLAFGRGPDSPLALLIPIVLIPIVVLAARGPRKSVAHGEPFVAAGNGFDQDHIRVRGVQRAQVRIEVVRIAGSIFRRIDPDTLEIAGARNGAREHGGHFVAGGELLELGLERVGCNERRARSWRVVGRQRSRGARCGAAGRLEG